MRGESLLRFTADITKGKVRQTIRTFPFVFIEIIDRRLRRLLQILKQSLG